MEAAGVVHLWREAPLLPFPSLFSSYAMPPPTIKPEFCARDEDQKCLYASERVCHHGKIQDDNAMRRVLEAQYCEWATVGKVLGSMTKEGFVPSFDQQAEERKRVTIALCALTAEAFGDIEDMLNE